MTSTQAQQLQTIYDNLPLFGSAPEIVGNRKITTFEKDSDSYTFSIHKNFRYILLFLSTTINPVYTLVLNYTSSSGEVLFDTNIESEQFNNQTMNTRVACIKNVSENSTIIVSITGKSGWSFGGRQYIIGIE